MSAKFTASVPAPDDWNRPLEQARQIMARAVDLTAIEVFGNIIRESPIDYGRLAGSFSIEQIDDLSWRIYTDVEYAEAVQTGTQPHVIEPKNGRALAFSMNGQTVIVKRVNHPGTKANPYITRALDGAKSRTDEFIQRAIRETVG